MKKERFNVCVNVHLLLQKDNHLLFYLRQNTGFADGFYNLIAGHIDGGETAIQAMIREAHEEAGIEIVPEDLSVVHTMHRKTDRENIDLFFLCNRWMGIIENKEPNKCGDLTFYPMLAPPENTMAYIKQVLNNISKKIPYSEFGWKS